MTSPRPVKPLQQSDFSEQSSADDFFLDDFFLDDFSKKCLWHRHFQEVIKSSPTG
jgi:hypothetical protein